MRRLGFSARFWTGFGGLILILTLLFFPSCRSGQQETQLIQAARSGDTDSLDTLLAAGAEVDQTGGRHHWSPLLHAIHKNQKQSVIRLLAARADVNRRSGNWTPLVMAAGYGYADMVRLLLEGGADPHLETASGVSPLAAAVSGAFDIDRFTLGQCQAETVETLLQRAPDLRLKENFSGRLARWVARLGGCSEILERTVPAQGHTG